MKIWDVCTTQEYHTVAICSSRDGVQELEQKRRKIVDLINQLIGLVKRAQLRCFQGIPRTIRKKLFWGRGDGSLIYKKIVVPTF